MEVVARRKEGNGEEGREVIDEKTRAGVAAAKY